jgi:hypothetical protein
MENFIKFLQETKTTFNGTVGDFNIFKNQIGTRISCNLECKPNHLQPLKYLGIKFDFSDKRAGFAYNQNHVGGTGNTLRVSCSMNLSVFILLAEFLRNDFRASMHNDQQLIWRGFKLKENKKYIEIPSCINLRAEELKNTIKRNVHTKKYSKQTLNSVLIQKVLNK